MIPNLLYNALIEIGLGDFSSRLYLYLLDKKAESKTMPEIKQVLNISALAFNFGTHRASIYKALDELKNIGLVDFENTEKTSVLVSLPSKVQSILQQKEATTRKFINDFEYYLPNMLDKYSWADKSFVKIFEGINKFIYAINELSTELDSNFEVLSFGEGGDFINGQIAEFVWGPWMKNRLKTQVNIRVLSKNDNKFLINKMSDNLAELRDVKFLPDEISAPGCLWVHKDIIFQWDPILMRAVKIRDKSLSRFYTQFFDYNWKIIQP